jgi:TldD protein
MRSVLIALLSLALIVSGLIAQAPLNDPDPILRAMVDELERSRALRVVDLDKPYYIQYSLEDVDVHSAAASLGGLVGANRNRSRIPQISVRVGGYEFDNTNHIFSGFASGVRYDPDQWPLDNDYSLLRQSFWLATDRAYKSAVESLSRKRAALKNAASPETLPDFTKAEPVRSIHPVKQAPFDESAITNRVVKLSTVFGGYPEIHNSAVNSQVYRGTSYFADSEGTIIRTPEAFAYIQARASAQASDGMPLNDLTIVLVNDPAGLPAEAELQRRVEQVAANVKALVNAPVGEGYSGPVLFEGTSAAQLLAQLIGDNLRVPRRPVSDPGRPAPFLPSDFETRVGSRILPEWIDVVDDATQKEWNGRKLLGHYPFDVEGVAPKRVSVVEKGTLKAFLTTRQPVKNSSGSTGHARLSGSYGVRAAAASNLFINASQAKPAAELKAQLIEMIKQSGKPYGMIVRKLDYPASASLRQLQAMMQGIMQSGGTSRPVSPPALIYRVYPDGREELVRGMRFRSLNTRVLRDILAASNESYAFDYMNTGAPFAISGAGGYLAPTTVISPALLFEEIELDKSQDELSRPPLVPPPPL